MAHKKINLNEKKGLWANIHAKRKRGEKMNPKGHPDAPTSKEMKMAQEAIQRRMDRMVIIATDPATGRKVVKIAPKKEILIGKGKQESVDIQALINDNILDELSLFDTETVDQLFELVSEDVLGDFIADAMLAEEEIYADSLSEEVQQLDEIVPLLLGLGRAAQLGYRGYKAMKTYNRAKKIQKARAADAAMRGSKNPVVNPIKKPKVGTMKQNFAKAMRQAKNPKMQGKMAKSLAGSAARAPVKYVKGINRAVDKGWKKLTKTYTPKGSAARKDGASFTHSIGSNLAKNTIAKPMAHSAVATSPNLVKKGLGYGDKFDMMAAHKGIKKAVTGDNPFRDKHNWKNKRYEGDGKGPKQVTLTFDDKKKKNESIEYVHVSQLDELAPLIAPVLAAKAAAKVGKAVKTGIGTMKGKSSFGPNKMGPQRKPQPKPAPKPAPKPGMGRVGGAGGAVKAPARPIPNTTQVGKRMIRGQAAKNKPTPAYGPSNQMQSYDYEINENIIGATFAKGSNQGNFNNEVDAVRDALAQIQELSPQTISSYQKKAGKEYRQAKGKRPMHPEYSAGLNAAGRMTDKDMDDNDEVYDKMKKRGRGLAMSKGKGVQKEGMRGVPKKQFMSANISKGVKSTQGAKKIMSNHPASKRPPLGGKPKSGMWSEGAMKELVTKKQEDERLAKRKKDSQYSDKEVRMGKGVAFDKRYKGGNMTGAYKTINKIKKGLGDHPKVADALRRANEEYNKGE